MSQHNSAMSTNKKAIEALEATKLLLNMNANSNEFYERRAQIRPFVDEALSALAGKQEHTDTAWISLDRYQELIYAVATKCPGETRHETALRYIREAEERRMAPGTTKQAAPPQTHDPK